MEQDLINTLKEKYPKLFIKVVFDNDFKLPPEKETGKIEYKRTLLNCNEKKTEKRASQMQRRITQGNKKAIYYIGVDDDGTIYGLSESELIESLDKFIEIANKIGASFNGVNIIHVTNKMVIKAGVIKKKIEDDCIDFEDENSF
ncbi:putative GTP-binding protein [Moumouvirus australiensis]|uniref:Putative GTP-binding protein n=1 Tax=Moumouvirus australiensis TaxID=2109587 RepID=A0A2P1EMG5_9VIRU|nr:putative GTP-binding protein [Moumouvirus australiensis]AVL95048.1 putative GTP-binding protein [Moumouvirus australiensis]